MRSSTLLAQIGACVMLLAIATRYSNAAEPETADQQKQSEMSVTNWQAQFGPVNFYDEALFQCMIRLHPKPKTAFTRFNDERLSDGILSHHRSWLDKIFRGRFHQALTNLPAKGFYMNEGRTEASLLLYELEFEENAVSLIESYNMFLVAVRPKGFLPARGIDRQVVGHVLFEWIMLNKLAPPIVVTPEFRTFDEALKSGVFFREEADGRFTLERRPKLFTVPYSSVDELLMPFNLSELLRVGDSFSNWPRSRGPLPPIRDWQESVFGFVSNEGLCFLLFKEESFPHYFSSPYDFNWLNKGLYQSDGRTLLDPPKNQSRNDPNRL